MNDKDRWLTDGDCSKCRRESYCTKACKAQKLRKQAVLRELVKNSRKK